MNAEDLKPNIEALILTVEYSLNPDQVFEAIEGKKMDMDFHIKQLYKQGYLDSEISEKTGIKYNRIRYWREKNRKPSNVKFKREKEKIESMIEEGYNNTEIAEKLGVTPRAVRYKLNRLGMKNNKKPKHVELFEKYYQEGKNDKEIARLTGKHYKTVWAWRDKNGLKSNFRRN